jgi:hypothetical protein
VAESATFAVDAFLEGDRLRRGVQLLVEDDRLSYDDVGLPLDEVFWVSRRAGLLLVFSRGYIAAFRASDDRLDDLNRAIDARLDVDALRAAVLEPLARESIVCSAAVAISGAVEDGAVKAGSAEDGVADGRSLKGLFVAVFTRQALHLFAREEAFRVPWPVTVARETAGEPRQARPALEIERGDTALRILYLRPEEISAILEVAKTAPPEPAEREEAIEMFARREVAGPTPARLPEFTTSTETIREQAEKQAATLPSDLPMRVGLPDNFFADHFHELGETALGPLLFRKSAASRARSLAKAVEAMDASALQEDARAATLNSLGRLTEAYDRELSRLLQGKRRAQKLGVELAVSEALRDSLQRRFLAPVHDLTPQFQRLEHAQAELRLRLERLEEGPPEAEESELDEAADEWHSALVLVDLDFATAWQELLPEIGVAWSESLLPALAEAAAAPRQRVPEWVKLLVIGLITTIVVAAVVLALLATRSAM